MECSLINTAEAVCPYDPQSQHQTIQTSKPFKQLMDVTCGLPNPSVAKFIWSQIHRGPNPSGLTCIGSKSQSGGESSGTQTHLDSGFWFLVSGFGILFSGFWIQDSSFWI